MQGTDNAYMQTAANHDHSVLNIASLTKIRENKQYLINADGVLIIITKKTAKLNVATNEQEPDCQDMLLLLLLHGLAHRLVSCLLSGMLLLNMIGTWKGHVSISQRGNRQAGLPINGKS